MSEATRIADQLRRAFDGDAWHGDSLFEILRGNRVAMVARNGFRNDVRMILSVSIAVHRSFVFVRDWLLPRHGLNQILHAAAWVGKRATWILLVGCPGSRAVVLGANLGNEHCFRFLPKSVGNRAWCLHFFSPN